VTSEPRTLLEALQRGLADASRTSDGIAPPAAILWTDPDAAWTSVIGPLRKLLPQLFALGPYLPDEGQGPAVWLKCVVARTIPGHSPPEGTVPILYLPGVARAALRAAEDCAPPLRPLVELCYRGQMWHQKNGRDWTVEAVLGGTLGLDLATDQATRAALARMLARVAVEPLAGLRGRRIDADALLRLDVEDQVGDLLGWMSDATAFRGKVTDDRWASFRTLCQKSYGFDPEADGVTVAGELLVKDKGAAWTAVWRRFCASPQVFPGLPKLLRMSYRDLFAGEADRNPRLNEEGETRLRAGLEAAADLAHADACERVIALEAEHAARRDLPWAELGESPLAGALEPLARLAQEARSPIGGATVAAVADSYAREGWRCDRAALDAMRLASEMKGKGAVVCKLVRTLYLPWLDRSARHLQDLMAAGGGPASSPATGTAVDPGTCTLFVDGLRYDLAVALVEKLAAGQMPASLSHRLAPVPTVTATAKPLAMPLAGGVGPGGAPEDFCPHLSGGAVPATVAKLRQLLEGQGAVVLDADDPQGPAAPDSVGWCETGQLDKQGHALHFGLVRQIEHELGQVVGVVEALMAVGWRRVRIVTDHGWLLVPDGLPKVDLPKSALLSRWARCASVKAGASPDAWTLPWHWDGEVRIATPQGVGSFVADTDYAHGGVSVQECVVPEILVSRGAVPVSATIEQADWRGLRLRVTVRTTATGVSVDLRRNRNQPASSIAVAAKAVGADGTASLVVEDDGNLGTAAVLVVLDADGNVAAAQAVTVGGD
jgi:hypothetical protein